MIPRRPPETLKGLPPDCSEQEAFRTFYLWSCDSPGVRTQDPILKRDVLYLLS